MNKVKLNIVKFVRDMVDIMLVKTVSVKNYYTTNCSYNITIDKIMSDVIYFEKRIYKYFNKRYIKMYTDIVASEFNLPSENEEDLGI